MNLDKKTCIRVGLGIFILYLCINYLPVVQSGIKTLLRALVPLIIGGAIAYIVNIPMSFYERHYFPKSQNRFAVLSRRPVCMIGAIISVIAIAVIIISLIVPQLISCIKLIVAEVQTMIEYIVNLAAEKELLSESFVSMITDFDWKSRIGNIIELFTKGVGGMMGSVLTTVASVLSGIVTAFLSIIFSVYILIAKEQLASQFKRLLARYLKRNTCLKIKHVCSVVDENFHSYIVGQCIEAVILGVLCTLGMLALGLPYAAMIGAFMAFTALIPVAGAYIGAIAGAVMIVTVSPFQALIFIIFVVVLQQIEGNFIYPKVVGSSIGLPGIWVLAAITVGGGIMGISGMLIGVPVAAAVYDLIREDVVRGETKAANRKALHSKSEAENAGEVKPEEKNAEQSVIEPTDNQKQ